MALRANGAKDGVNRQGAVQGTSINNGATIAMAGNVPSTGDTNDAGLGEVLGAGSNFNFKPSKIDQDTFSETEGASVANRGKRGGIIEARGLGTGTFAYDNQRGVIRTVSTTINGVANTTLESGGVGKGGRANSSIGGLNSFSPLPRYSFKADGSILAKVNSPGGVNAATGWDATMSFIDPAVAGGATVANDGAAAPTRAIPGELAYMESAKIPKQDDYKAKTG